MLCLALHKSCSDINFEKFHKVPNQCVFISLFRGFNIPVYQGVIIQGVRILGVALYINFTHINLSCIHVACSVGLRVHTLDAPRM